MTPEKVSREFYREDIPLLVTLLDKKLTELRARTEGTEVYNGSSEQEWFDLHREIGQYEALRRELAKGLDIPQPTTEGAKEVTTMPRKSSGLDQKGRRQARVIRDRLAEGEIAESTARKKLNALGAEKHYVDRLVNVATQTIVNDEDEG